MKLSKLPVFIVCGKSPIQSYGGGYSTFALNLATVLTSLGYKVYIIAVGEKNKEIKTSYATIVTFKTFLFDYYTTALPSLPIASVIFVSGIKNIVKKKGYDKFIVWGIGPWGFAGAILKLQLRKRVIFLNNYFTTLRHEWKGGLNAIRVKDYGLLLKVKFWIIYYSVVMLLSFFERFVLSKADYIITNYNSTEVILQKEFHIQKSRFLRTTFLTKIYSRDAKRGKTLDKADLPKKYLLYLSRQDPRKGINFLLHAIAIICKSNPSYMIPVVIAGTGQMLDANKKLAKKLGIHTWVTFAGFINNSESILKNASVFCFPTIEEGAGALIINEAMSLGVPIVSTRCDGIKEDIEDRESGLLVPMGDSAAFAHAVLELLKNPELAKKLGNNAKKRYKERFNYQSMKKDIEHVLSKVNFS